MKEHIYETVKAFANWLMVIGLAILSVMAFASQVMDVGSAWILMDILPWPIAICVIALVFEAVRIFMDSHFKFEEDEEL